MGRLFYVADNHVLGQGELRIVHCERLLTYKNADFRVKCDNVTFLYYGSSSNIVNDNPPEERAKALHVLIRQQARISGIELSHVEGGVFLYHDIESDDRHVSKPIVIDPPRTANKKRKCETGGAVYVSGNNNATAIGGGTAYSSSSVSSSSNVAKGQSVRQNSSMRAKYSFQE